MKLISTTTIIIATLSSLSSAWIMKLHSGSNQDGEHENWYSRHGEVGCFVMSDLSDNVGSYWWCSGGENTTFEMFEEIDCTGPVKAKGGAGTFEGRTIHTELKSFKVTGGWSTCDCFE